MSFISQLPGSELLLLLLRCLLLCAPLALCLGDLVPCRRREGSSLRCRVADEDAAGRSLRLAGEEPAIALRACCRRAIWASIAVNISEVVIAPLYQDAKNDRCTTQGVCPPTFRAERLNLMTKNRMMWDEKGLPAHEIRGHFDQGQIKEEERRRQIGKMRRRWAEQDACPRTARG